MKNRFQITTERLTYLFGGVILLGSITSGILNPDKRWMEWHFSRLGEGGMLSAYIFNISLVIAAGLIFFIGRRLTDEITKIDNLPEKKLLRAKKIINRSFYLVTACLLVVAIFPFDQNQVIHNVFGYSMLFTFLYLCIFIARILPIFSHRYYIYGFEIIATTVICYTLFLAFKIITLLEVETILFSMLYIWLILFIKGIHYRSEPAMVTVVK